METHPTSDLIFVIYLIFLNIFPSKRLLVIQEHQQMRNNYMSLLDRSSLDRILYSMRRKIKHRAHASTGVLLRNSAEKNTSAPSGMKNITVLYTETRHCIA